MLRVTTTGWRRCETLESMSALLCHQKGTFSGNRSLLCAVDGILCDSACGEYASRFAGEVVLAARQPVASLRLLRRKPLLYFHPSFFQRGWINCPELPWDLHLISVLSGQRLLSAIWPVTWFTGLRTEYWILPGGIPSFTINIPKAKTLFRERWWERVFFMLHGQSAKECCFSLDLMVTRCRSKSAWACQSGVVVLWGPGPQLRGVPYLLGSKSLMM